MQRISIIAVLFLICLIPYSYCEDMDDGEDADDVNPEDSEDINVEESTSSPPATEVPIMTFEIPSNVIIERHNATDYIASDNEKHHVMGISDKKCDNANYNLATDFDPKNETEIEINTKCYEDSPYPIDDTLQPLMTILEIPKRYMPIHRCMRTYIRYSERIPMIGPHRPLWAKFGEYQYLPPQRWLHNIEHGSIVLLYHPCVDKELLNQYKNLVKKCLFRHIITPFPTLSKERPIALLGWSASLEFSYFDFELSKNFIKFYARSGPERMFRDGRYKHLLIEKAQVVTNVIDSNVCPNL